MVFQQRIMSSANSEFYFFSNLDSFYFFFFSDCCGQDFQNYMNSSGESGHLVLFLILEEMLSVFTIEDNVCCWFVIQYMAFIMLSYVPYIYIHTHTHKHTHTHTHTHIQRERDHIFFIHSTCQQTFRLFPCLGYCEQCCYEHRDACVFLNYSFVQICAQEWDCSIIWKHYFQVFEEPLYCFPGWLGQQWMYHIPTLVQEGSLFSTTSPAFVI